MKIPDFNATSLKWLFGSLLLGIVLGACFTVILRAPSPLPAPTAALVDPPLAVIDRALAEGLQRAQSLADQGKGEEAASILEDLTEQFPGSPEPFNNLAALRASQGELEAGRELLEQALRTHEGFAAAYENLGVIFSEIARISYGKALRLDIPPSNPELKVISVPTPVPPSAAIAVVESAPPATEAAEELEARSASTSPPRSSPPPAPQPSAPAEPRVESPSTDKTQQILQTLEGWAAAWSDRDVPRYLSYYSARFRPDGDMTRSAWEEIRHQRIRHPSWIRVELSDIDVTATGTDSVRVTMIQDYSADTYKGRSRKTMDLVREDGSWRILTENSLGTAR